MVLIMSEAAGLLCERAGRIPMRILILLSLNLDESPVMSNTINLTGGMGTLSHLPEVTQLEFELGPG